MFSEGSENNTVEVGQGIQSIIVSGDITSFSSGVRTFRKRETKVSQGDCFPVGSGASPVESGFGA